MLKLYDAFIVAFIQYTCFYILFKKRGFWVLDYNLSYYYGANIRFNLQHNKIVSVVVFIKKTEFLQLISEYRHVMNSKKCINCK